MKVRDLFIKDDAIYTDPYYKENPVEIYDTTYDVCYGILTEPIEISKSIEAEFADVLDYECWVYDVTAVMVISENYDPNKHWYDSTPLDYDGYNYEYYEFSDEESKRFERAESFFRAIGLM